MAEPCYSVYQNSTATIDDGDEAACSNIESNYRNESLFANNFGGYVNVSAVRHSVTKEYQLTDEGELG